MMAIMETPTLQILGHALDLTAIRQRIVSQNVANVDTPGYETQDIDFRGELRRAIAGDDSFGTQPLVRTVPDLEARPDGNNVNIDREGLLMAQNQLQFQTDVALLRSEFNRLQWAINGGSSQ